MTTALRNQAVDIYSRGLARITPEVLLRQALTMSGNTLELTFLEGSHSLPLAPEGGIVLLAMGFNGPVREGLLSDLGV